MLKATATAALLSLNTAVLPCAARGDPCSQPLGRGAVRFFATETDFKAAPPSFALEQVPKQSLPMPAGFAVIPEFSSAEGKRVVTVKTPEGASLYGLGAEPGPLLRNGFDSKGRPVECPWVMAVRTDGSAFGVLADTTWVCSVDLTHAIEFRSVAPVLPVIVFEAADPESLVRSLNELTGRIEMPPRWALGPIVDGGWPEASVASTVSRLRDAGIPADGVIVGSASGDDALIPGERDAAENPRMLKAVHDAGLHAIKRIGVQFTTKADSPVYKAGQDGEHWLQTADGNEIWDSVDEVIPDFTRKATRDWWTARVRKLADAGFEGVAVHEWWSLLDDQTHFRADEGLGGPGSLAQYLPAMTKLLVGATRLGFPGESSGVRPCIISEAIGSTPESPSDAIYPLGVYERALASRRARHSGGHFEAPGVVPRLLSGSLSGATLQMVMVPGAPEDSHLDLPADADLKREWNRILGAASLAPVCGCADLSNPGESPGACLRVAFSRRSRLIPNYYTLCFNAFAHCDPILRPVFFADPTDASLRGIDTMFLAGRDLLVIPKLTADGPKPKPPLKGAWRKVDFEDGDQPDLPDLYLRPGAILPLGPVMQHTGEKPMDPLTLVINLDPQGTATGELFEDDGDGYAFYHNGCRRMVYRATTEGGSVLIRLATLDGGWPIPKRKVEVRILTDSGGITGGGSERGTIKIDLPAPKSP